MNILYKEVLNLLPNLFILHHASLIFHHPGQTPEVKSSNSRPVANISQDVLLSCLLHRRNDQQRITRVTVTWEKKGQLGFVYEYKDGHPEFGNQNEAFKGRVEIFPSLLVEGNASLLLRNVRMTDEGFYSCRIGSSDGGGRINIQLNVAGEAARPSRKESNMERKDSHQRGIKVKCLAKLHFHMVKC